ncbi:NUDIX hydrolase [Paeniglutamicibacter cryotolerans]|uniref:8-oxo-dGTP pyrophosphatase MutT (NUDIX family) n=1 Tax=Paeniglutamicibacter cryotolerans TaxID=670079 RepID=A0A839QE99_9MICC|nr:CoA pyrophosphatase [Paeniglutamicibacter cryotolerans]MBB2994240.1 8-oxo-dGTP pyrophosphatase MutT (NUDIX family) [Paeniglutamicibacter cryotolerans]
MSARDQLLAVIARHGVGKAAGDAAAVSISSATTAVVTKMPETWVFNSMDHALARPAAVLILFGRLDEVPAANPAPTVPSDLDVLFVQRADTLRKHPGQIAFPGGKIDDTDASPSAAALREAVEETGLDPDGVQLLGVLPDAELPVTNFLVTPVIGWWARESEVFAVDPGESSTVFRTPVADLLDPANRVSAVVERDGQRFSSPAFAVAGGFIWGFTAIVLDRLFNDLGWTLPWDATIERKIGFTRP